MNNFDDNQLVVSFELLQLLKWLLEEEHCTLRKLISKTLNKGLQERLTKPSMDDCCETSEDMQQYIMDFFIVLESMLLDSIQEKDVNKVIERNLLPALDHIDATSFDEEVLNNSIAKASSISEGQSNKDPKEVLYKELLKRWKPAKSIIYN